MSYAHQSTMIHLSPASFQTLHYRHSLCLKSQTILHLFCTRKLTET